MNIHEEIYDGHLIRANATGAMVFLDGSKSLEEKFRAKTLEEALEKSKGWIDAKMEERMEERRDDHIGTVEGYVEALGLQKLSKAKRLMLVAHRRADDRAMTPQELAEAAGWKSHSSANTHYAKLGKAVAEQLNLKIEGEDKQSWTSALAEYDADTSKWKMHAEVAEAMDELGIG